MDDDWKEWRNHILDEIRDMKTILLSHHESLGGLKVKAGIFGSLGGILTVVLFIAIELLTNKSPF